MNTVIGLFSVDQKINRELNLLDRAGFVEDDIQVITLDHEVNKLFSRERHRIFAKDTGWCAFIIGVTYIVFALLDGWCQGKIFHNGITIALEIVLVGFLVGAFIGGPFGLLAGIAEYEEKMTPYTRGVRMGSKVIAVKVNEGEADKAMQVLKLGGTNRVRFLPIL